MTDELSRKLFTRVPDPMRTDLGDSFFGVGTLLLRAFKRKPLGEPPLWSIPQKQETHTYNCHTHVYWVEISNAW